MRSLAASNRCSTMIGLLSVCIELSHEYALSIAHSETTEKPSCMQRHHTGMLLRWFPLHPLLTKSKEMEGVARDTHPKKQLSFRCTFKVSATNSHVAIEGEGSFIQCNESIHTFRRAFFFCGRLEKERFSLPVQSV